MAFITGLISVHFVLVGLYTRIAMPRSRISRLDSQFLGLKGDLDYLFLGDSHCQDDINPNLLNNAFNFASAGENYLQTFYKVRCILRTREDRIGTVVLPLDLHSFSSFRLGRIENPPYWSRYIDFLDLGRDEGQQFKYFREFLEAELFPYLGRGKDCLRLLNTIAKTPLPMKRGYIAFDGRRALRRKSSDGAAKRRASLHLEVEDLFAPLFIESFHMCVELCQKRGVRVVLVKYPVSSRYLEEAKRILLANGHSVEEVEKKLVGIASEKHCVEIFDFRDLFLNRDGLFVDPDHLTARGAVRFSETLRARLASDLGPQG